MSEKKSVPVACALLQRDGLVLIAQRPPHKQPALKWEFPGGKIEAGESATQALIRELREELGCEIEILQPLPRSSHDYGGLAFELVPFLCRLAPASPEPAVREHLALRWIFPRDLAAFDLAAADLPIVATWKSLRPDDFVPPARADTL